jgi:NAD(P)-dependent dehydrogenase (short-subunit alcohol dehydrogenase family)
VANAAIVHGADFLEVDEADFERVLRVNLKGVFLTGQVAARAMVAGGRSGAIVNMSSINAQVALPDQVPYCVAKGGIQQLTRVMSLSLARHGIRVNAVGPGSIATEMLESGRGDRRRGRVPGLGRGLLRHRPHPHGRRRPPGAQLHRPRPRRRLSAFKPSQVKDKNRE